MKIDKVAIIAKSQPHIEFELPLSEVDEVTSISQVAIG